MKARFLSSKSKLTLFFLVLFALAAVFFRESFTNNLFLDDFFNIHLSQVQPPLDWFNIFKKPVLDFYFYRPLTTQAFWGVGYKIFGLQPLGYHVVMFTSFLFSCLLFYVFIKKLANSERIALFSVLFYTLSASHFYRLFFLSQIQEIWLAMFTLLSAIAFLNKSKFVFLFFLLALLSKESAVIIPVFLLGLSLVTDRKQFRVIAALFILALLYFVIRVFFFGLPGGNTYDYNFSPHKIANNYFWYTLWSLGIPEHFVNVKIFSLKTGLNPQLFTAFGAEGQLILGAVTFFVLFMVTRFRQALFQRKKEFLIGFGIFITFLLPVAFFPFHKFPYSLTIPLMGVSLILGTFVSLLKKWEIALVLVLFFLVSNLSISFNLNNHWAKKRSEIQAEVFSFFKKNYPQTPSARNIYFRNNDWLFCRMTPDNLHRSSEVAYAIGGVYGLRLTYMDPSLQIYFEDEDNNTHLYLDSLMLNSKEFVK